MAVSAIAIRRVRLAVQIMSADWWDSWTMAVSAIAIRRVRSAVLPVMIVPEVWWDASGAAA